MTEANQSLVERALQSFEMKDMESLMGYFADDALFFDPHYPEPALQGKTAIQQGFEFAFGMLRQPGFTIRHFWTTERDGAIEVDTHHIFQDGNGHVFPRCSHSRFRMV